MTAEKLVVQQITAVIEAHPARPGFEMGAIEAWLRHDLSSRFDATLAEGLPLDMLALLGGPH